jgi:hypothetical protein
MTRHPHEKSSILYRMTRVSQKRGRRAAKTRHRRGFKGGALGFEDWAIEVADRTCNTERMANDLNLEYGVLVSKTTPANLNDAYDWLDCRAAESESYATKFLRAVPGYTYTIPLVTTGLFLCIDCLSPQNEITVRRPTLLEFYNSAEYGSAFDKTKYELYLMLHVDSGTLHYVNRLLIERFMGRDRSKTSDTLACIKGGQEVYKAAPASIKLSIPETYEPRYDADKLSQEARTIHSLLNLDNLVALIKKENKAVQSGGGGANTEEGVIDKEGFQDEIEATVEGRLKKYSNQTEDQNRATLVSRLNRLEMGAKKQENFQVDLALDLFKELDPVVYQTINTPEQREGIRKLLLVMGDAVQNQHNETISEWEVNNPDTNAAVVNLPTEDELTSSTVNQAGGAAAAARTSWVPSIALDYVRSGYTPSAAVREAASDVLKAGGSTAEELRRKHRFSPRDQTANIEIIKLEEKEAAVMEAKVGKFIVDARAKVVAILASRDGAALRSKHRVGANDTSRNEYIIQQEIEEIVAAHVRLLDTQIADQEEPDYKAMLDLERGLFLANNAVKPYLKKALEAATAARSAPLAAEFAGSSFARPLLEAEKRKAASAAVPTAAERKRNQRWSTSADAGGWDGFFGELWSSASLKGVDTAEHRQRVAEVEKDVSYASFKRLAKGGLDTKDIETREQLFKIIYAYLKVESQEDFKNQLRDYFLPFKTLRECQVDDRGKRVRRQSNGSTVECDEGSASSFWDDYTVADLQRLFEKAGTMVGDALKLINEAPGIVTRSVEAAAATGGPPAAVAGVKSGGVDVDAAPKVGGGGAAPTSTLWNYINGLFGAADTALKVADAGAKIAAKVAIVATAIALIQYKVGLGLAAKRVERLVVLAGELVDKVIAQNYTKDDSSMNTDKFDRFLADISKRSNTGNAALRTALENANSELTSKIAKVGTINTNYAHARSRQLQGAVSWYGTFQEGLGQTPDETAACKGSTKTYEEAVAAAGAEAVAAHIHATDRGTYERWQTGCQENTIRELERSARVQLGEVLTPHANVSPASYILAILRRVDGLIKRKINEGRKPPDYGNLIKIYQYIKEGLEGTELDVSTLMISRFDSMLSPDRYSEISERAGYGILKNIIDNLRPMKSLAKATTYTFDNVVKNISSAANAPVKSKYIRALMERDLVRSENRYDLRRLSNALEKPTKTPPTDVDARDAPFATTAPLKNQFTKRIYGYNSPRVLTALGIEPTPSAAPLEKPPPDSNPHSPVGTPRAAVVGVPPTPEPVRVRSLSVVPGAARGRGGGRKTRKLRHRAPF